MSTDGTVVVPQTLADLYALIEELIKVESEAIRTSVSDHAKGMHTGYLLALEDTRYWITTATQSL